MSEGQSPMQVHSRWMALVAWLALLTFGVAVSVYGATASGMMGGLFDWMRSLFAMAETLGRAGTSAVAITLSAVNLGLVVLAIALLVIGWLHFIRLSEGLFSAYAQEAGTVTTLYQPLVRQAGQVLLFFVLSIAVSLLSQPILSFLQNLLR